MNLKNRLYQIIFEHNTRSGKNFDVILILLVVLSMLAIMLETVEGLWNNYYQLFYYFEWFFTIIFTIEFILRLYCARSKKGYVLSFYGLVDIISVLPTYLSVFIPGAQAFLIIRAMRLMRLFRIFKLTNYTNAGSQLKEAMTASKPKIIVFVFFVVTFVTIVGTAMFYIEGRDNGFTSIPKSIYWAVVTMTTVGYGDIAPVTVAGKMLASVMMLTGFAIIAVPTGIVTSELQRERDEVPMDVRECGECGRRGHDQQARFCKMCGCPLSDQGSPPGENAAGEIP